MYKFLALRTFFINKSKMKIQSKIEIWGGQKGCEEIFHKKAVGCLKSFLPSVFLTVLCLAVAVIRGPNEMIEFSVIALCETFKCIKLVRMQHAAYSWISCFLSLRISVLLDAKGGGRKGRYQGKANSLKGRKAINQMLKEYTSLPTNSH